MSRCTAEYVMRDQVRDRVEEIMRADPRGQAPVPSRAYGILVGVGILVYLAALSTQLA
jgi:hypothetical protein